MASSESGEAQGDDVASCDSGDRHSPVVLWMDVTDGCTTQDDASTSTCRAPAHAAQVEMANFAAIQSDGSAAAAQMTPLPVDINHVACQLALARAQLVNMQLVAEINALRMQLHAATASVPLAQRVYSYTRALLCGTEGLLSLCALVLLAAAVIGVSMGLGRFGDYFLGIQFLSNPTQKVLFFLGLHSYYLQFEYTNPNMPATKLNFTGPFCNLDPATCPGDVPPLFDYYDGINPCLCVDSMTMADRDLAFGLLWIALGLGCLLMLNCIVTPCLHAISSESVRKIVKVWFPATTGSFLATIIAVAAWKLYISMTNFARRRADDISNNGQRGGSGSGSSDQLDVLPTALSRAFVAMVAVLSTSAVPVVLALCIYARTRYIAHQQVFPGSADAPAPSH